jgi:uncharacterized protein YbgA (DUF1722 family)/uncharacterized protein YbbK (DUF523 family)
MSDPIRVGISSCLLGNPVRYNGGHQRDPYITDTLGKFFEYVPVCPEVECGLPVPRETMRLVGDPESPRLLTSQSGIDHTDRMLGWARRKVKELEGEDLHAFICKSKSPSSGMERVKVYTDATNPRKIGVGLFARELQRHFPLLPMEEEGRLHDPNLRENFIERIFVYRRWRELQGQRQSRGGLVAFHTAHKLQIMAHSVKHYRDMGKLVANPGGRPLPQLFAEYERMLMESLALKATVKKNCNVLQHMVGYFKKVLSPGEKQELLELIERYRDEYLPLIVPITLLNHYVRKYQVGYLAGQSYLEPHPQELKLRNHA